MGEHARRHLALVGIGVVLLLSSAVIPVAPVRWHDTSPEVPQFAEGNATALTQEGYEIVAYENLSQRGKHLYVKTLTGGGEYRVAVGDGAEEFEYATREATIERAASSPGPIRIETALIVVERPNGSDLPAADERSPDARFDVMRTKTAAPPLVTPARAPQLTLVLAGVACLGVGGTRFATL